MKNILASLLASGLIAASCSSLSKNIFSKKTPHEKYEEKLDDNSLDKTPEGKQWLTASKIALENAQLVQLPYGQHGYFAADKPRALGLRFSAKRGERISFSLSKKTPFNLFADVFKEGGDLTSPLLSVDTSSSEFIFDADETSTYILRLQPELFRSGEYSLSISIGPSLGFPVGNNKGKIGSFWGDSRDGGKRRHEGIDIFAPKLTPVIAAEDGMVTGVKNEGIGGKTVWLRVANNITLYYAHLDKQSVQSGQLVKKGETLGLVGNTGNAKHTPAHLHFGIYTYNGPIDPLPFINPEIKTASTVPEKNMKIAFRLTKTQKSGEITAIANTILIPLAVNQKGYVCEMPDGNLIQVPFPSVKPLSNIKTDVLAESKTKTNAKG
jgi:murein DD-endopeptidase MepM/ murein hydrolase activator NlpD